jgi:hypothetical protein
LYDEALALFLQYFDKLRHFFRVGDAKQLVHRVKLHKQAVQNGQVARALVQYPLCDALEGLVWFLRVNGHECPAKVDPYPMRRRSASPCRPYRGIYLNVPTFS